MKIIRAYKVELDPNNRQRTLLLKSAGVARFVYNWGLENWEKEFKETGKPSSVARLDANLNRIKKAEYGWMYEVSKWCGQNALWDLDSAYKKFFKQKKGSTKAFRPRFKSKKNHSPSFRISFDACSYKVSRDHIQIPRIGIVRLKRSGYIPGTLGVPVKFYSATFKQSGGGRWFVSVQCEVETSAPAPESEKRIGIDVGLKRFAVTSDGEFTDNPRFLRKRLKSLIRAQRRKDRGLRNSRNRDKALRKFLKIHHRVACCRNDFVNKFTSRLVRTNPGATFIIETLNIKGMKKVRRISKSVVDAGWGHFSRQMEYKVKWYGGKLVRASGFYPSSKLCSRCGVKNQNLQVSDREFVCSSCGLRIDRDLNGSYNLRDYQLPQVLRKVTPVESRISSSDSIKQEESPEIEFVCPVSLSEHMGVES